jgi:hypothetical protein
MHSGALSDPGVKADIPPRLRADAVMISIRKSWTAPIDAAFHIEIEAWQQIPVVEEHQVI